MPKEETGQRIPTPSSQAIFNIQPRKPVPTIIPEAEKGPDYRPDHPHLPLNV